jgi:predicted CXXCH cytochrome family protein
VRKISWALFVVVLLVGLMPLLSDVWQGDEPAGNLASEPASKHVDLHKLWLSGPLLPAHELATGNNCSACHEKPFVQVQDNACQQCHSTLGAHALASDVESGQIPAKHEKWVAELDDFTCQNCHKEHNEPGSIVSRSESVCLNCHQEMDPAVKGFSQDTHPAFALTLLRPDLMRQGGVPVVNWQREKVRPRMSEASASQAAPEKEENYLKYPHDIHLDPEEVKHPVRGDALQCADCHTLTADREHFEPIRMEKHCVSCHDLSFDPRTPQKQLPHGSPKAVYETLEAHYVKLAFSPEVLDGFERRRLPGREQEEEGCDKDYECARQQALRETGRQFSQRGCVTCHEVSELDDAEGAERWQVLPVKINHNWYADARFDHQSHLTQSDQRGDALCKTCHSADTSDKSSDILIPGIAQCTDCHDSQAQAGRVALSCVSCHDYHRYSTSGHPEGQAELMKAEPTQGANHGKL